MGGNTSLAKTYHWDQDAVFVDSEKPLENSSASNIISPQPNAYAGNLNMRNPKEYETVKRRSDTRKTSRNQSPKQTAKLKAQATDLQTPDSGTLPTWHVSGYTKTWQRLSFARQFIVLTDSDPMVFSALLHQRACLVYNTKFRKLQLIILQSILVPLDAAVSAEPQLA